MTVQRAGRLERRPLCLDIGHGLSILSKYLSDQAEILPLRGAAEAASIAIVPYL